MAFQTVFKRYELKYIMTREQKERILSAMLPYMQLDHFGRTTIRNIYYDTDSYRLIRRSIEAPLYKEKLRLRSYCRADEDSTVFMELKKKYDSVVYKRRLALKEREADEWIYAGKTERINTQISREIDDFISRYPGLHPAMFISYEREAYFTKTESDFRVTFDENILFRQQELSLSAPVWGEAVLPHGSVLMEIKCSGGIPLWMVSALSQNAVRKTSFSKYGAAYKSMISAVKEAV